MWRFWCKRSLSLLKCCDFEKIAHFVRYFFIKRFTLTNFWVRLIDKLPERSDWCESLCIVCFHLLPLFLFVPHHFPTQWPNTFPIGKCGELRHAGKYATKLEYTLETRFTARWRWCCMRDAYEKKLADLEAQKYQLCDTNKITNKYGFVILCFY